ncbi:MAG: hypothetical protein II187_04875 [Treponema sp.]|nr:hypothetical protein [Treponema sp.]
MLRDQIIQTIALFLVMLLCIAGFFICTKIQKKPKVFLKSLPVLSGKAQVLEAINSGDEKLYLVENYQFDRVKTFKDPSTQSHLNKFDDDFIYYDVRKMIGDDSNHIREKYGRLFFDEDVELLDFSGSYVCGAPSKKTGRADIYHTVTLKGEEVDWYVTPNAVFTFVAKLGAGKAELSGYKGDRVIVSGGSRDVLLDNFSSSQWCFRLKILLAVCAFAFLIGVIGWIVGINETLRLRSYGFPV